VHLNRTALSLLATFTLAAPVAGALAQDAAAATAAKPARLGSRTLQQGSKGADVRQLQTLLRRTGFAVGVDGQFGPGTAAVVRSFQSVTGLKINGIADRATVGRLQVATRPSPAAAAAENGGYSEASAQVRRKWLGDRLPVRQGMSGPDVRQLQDFLRKAGVRSVSTDGQFGGGTQRAVRAWEASVRRRADGQMDGGDVARLRTQVGRIRGGAAAVSAAPATPTTLTAPGSRAKVGANGLAIAPADAPAAVKQIIAAGNQIATKPYIYGGGHRADWKMDAGYDCSGSVSWALHGAGLVKSPAPSGGYYNWGLAGPGQWVTIYTKDSHMYMVVAGLRFDTSGRSNAGTRWQADMRPSDGFVIRHPAGL
jgi:peptidoglycan hydrolase-like protein with peptidoglycan-binding domain